MFRPAIFWSCLFLAFPVFAEENLLENPNFEEGLEGWSVHRSTGGISIVEQGNEKAAVLERSATAERGLPLIQQEFAVIPGDILEATAEAKVDTPPYGKGGYLSFSFFGPGPERLDFTQSASTHDLHRWTNLRLVSVVPENATKARLCLIFHGTGSVQFRSAGLRIRRAQWEESEKEEGILKFSTGESLPLAGFGVEDDGWFYNAENLGNGFSEEDVRIREDRIREMDPDWVRMFVWYHDWNPSGDWETFDFESDNMQSRYRTLDLYQAIGARVNLVGVEWRQKDPYGQPEKTAHAIGELFEHLVRDRGYTCIEEWTLSNEPNHYFPRMGYTFEDYVRLHRLVAEEFERRGLKIRIVGSDDAEDFGWFSKCVEDEQYLGLVDLLSSHRYFKKADRVLAGEFFHARRERMLSARKEIPLVLAEFGFQDQRSTTFDNPIMKTFEYALWTASLVIEGLNEGYSGFSIWTLHEVNYPGSRRMVYGLWDYRDNDWALRPVYYAWKNFCSLTEPGDPVVAGQVTPFRKVKAARVGDTVFWVNENPESKSLSIEEVDLRSGRAWTEEALSAGREEGLPLDCRENRVVLPAASFGYLGIAERE